jgi:hypothetical protein
MLIFWLMVMVEVVIALSLIRVLVGVLVKV